MSYFDTTVFNRIAMQQKETNDLLRELIKTLQEQKSKCRYPTQNFEPPVPAQQPEVGVVAYLDVGANGYLDLGSELSEDALQQLPKGRHALVIAGTYGIDGYAAAPQPSHTAQAAVSVQEDAAYAELPEPHHRGPAGTGNYFSSFTADQMRAFADATHALRVESLAAAYREELDKLSQRNYELRTASHGQAQADSVHCMMETAEDSVYIMSDLDIWKPFIRNGNIRLWATDGESNG